MEASSIAGLSTILLATTGASLAAIASFLTAARRKKSEVHINIRTASGSKLSIEGSNITETQAKEIMRILKGAKEAPREAPEPSLVA